MNALAHSRFAGLADLWLSGLLAWRKARGGQWTGLRSKDHPSAAYAVRGEHQETPWDEVAWREDWG